MPTFTLNRSNGAAAPRAAGRIDDEEEPGMARAIKCTKHVYEDVAGVCHDCGEPWCRECLLPPAGNRAVLRCVECALVAAGIRPRKLRRQPTPTY